MNLLIFIFMFVYIIGWELNRAKAYPFDVLSFINASFALVYVLTPIILIAIPEIAVDNKLTSTGFSDLSAGLILVTIAFVSLQIGWLAAPRRRHIFAPTSSNPFTDIKTQRLCYLGLIVAGISLYAYVQAFGGLLPALALGALIRYNLTFTEALDLGASSTGLYFVSIANSVGLYSFYRIFLKKNADHTRFYWVAFAASLVLGGLLAVTMASRGAVLMLVFNYYIGAAICRKRFYLPRLAVLLILAIAFGTIGKSIFSDISALVAQRPNLSGDSYFSDALDAGLGQRILASLANEGAHGIVSIERVLDRRGSSADYTGMSQFYNWPLDLVPRRLMGVEFDKPIRISEVNSNLLGFPGSGIPPGLIASFLYGAGVAGVVFGMFLYGFVGRILQSSMSKWLSTYPGSVAVIVPLMMAYGLFVGNGDPSVFIKDAFGVLVAACGLLLIARFSGASRNRVREQGGSVTLRHRVS